MTTTWIIASMIILTTIIVKIIKQKRKDPEKKEKLEVKKEEVHHEKTEASHDKDSTKNDDHGHSEHKAKSSILPTIATWLIVISSSILIIVWISLGVKNLLKDKEPDKYEWVVKNKQTVFFTGSYNEVTYLYSGKNISFEDASEPYCIKNNANEEVCGEKGEDVGPKMPNSHDNMTLRFKSQNGKNGQITIVFWVWKKVKK